MTGRGPQTLRDRVRDVLVDGGSWVHRSDFAHLTTCAVALDDVLADMVVDGVAEFKTGSGYRLLASDLVRKAMRQLYRKPDLKRVVITRQLNRQISMGIAERRASVGVVMYELQLPPAKDDDEALDQAVRLADFWNTHMELKDGHPGP